jgi:hypothetical protein
MPAGPTDDPLEVITQIRSASMILGDSRAGFVDPGGPLRAAHVRAARTELEQRGRATFLAERWATQPVAARARVIWRGWAQSFTGSLSWEQRAEGDVNPSARAQLDELTSLLSGPATRGELRVLGAYEAYFQTLFTLGWALVVRADPGGDARRLAAPGESEIGGSAAQLAWQEIVGAWIAPWSGRRRHDAILEALLAWVEQHAPGAIQPGETMR